MSDAKVYGLAGQFQTPEQMLEGARKLYDAGFRQFDTYSPYTVEELKDIPLFAKTPISIWTLTGGIVGGSTGFGMQYYANVIGYPQNVAGHPLNSWPAFIPITFALTILFAALSTVLGVFVCNQLPAPYHPIFNLNEFNFGETNRFFICVEKADPKFDSVQIHAILAEAQAVQISPVNE